MDTKACLNKTGFCYFTMSNQNPVDSGALSRADRARKSLGPVLNAKTREAVSSETASPFAPVVVEFQSGDNLYSLLFRPQDVKDRDFDEFTDRRNKAILQLQKRIGINGEGDGFTTAQIIKALPEDEIAPALRMVSGADSRPDRIGLYVPHIEAWNVLDEEGEMAPLDIDAFCQNGGVYDAALDACEKAFLHSRGRQTVETESTAPSSTTGDTPSTAGEMASPILALVESRDGTSNSN